MAGNRYILNIINRLPKPKFNEYLEILKDEQNSSLPRYSMIHLGCMQGHNALVLQLLKDSEGVKLEINFSNCIAHASAASNISTVEILLNAWKRTGNKHLDLTSGKAPIYDSKVDARYSQYNALQHAALNNNVKIAVLVLANGAKTNFPIWYPSEFPIRLAALKGSVEMVEMLSKHVWWNKGSKLALPLATAAEQGFVLFPSLKHVTLWDMLTSMYSHIDTVKALLKAGAKITVNNASPSAIHLAAKEGHRDIFELLLRKGAKDSYIDYKTGRYTAWGPMLNKQNWCCVHFAAFGGHYNLVKYLLEERIEPPITLGTLKYKETALPIAAMQGHVRVVELLLEKGFPVNVEFYRKETALHASSIVDNIEMMTFLLNHGAKVDPLDSDNNSPLHRARSLPAVLLLLNRGADKETINYAGDTVLHIAARFGNRDIVYALIKAGSQLDVINKQGHTPTRCAIENNHEACLTLLLESGASTEIAGKSWYSDLQFAATLKRCNMIPQLLKYGANIEAEDILKMRPLHAAAYAGDVDSVELLLSEVRNFFGLILVIAILTIPL